VKFRPPAADDTKLSGARPAEPKLTRVRGTRIVSVEFHERQLADIAAGRMTAAEALEQKEW
jgi:hypothetical protein